MLLLATQSASKVAFHCTACQKICRWLQVKFLSFALGGSTVYNTARMDAAHERLIIEQGMTMEAFDITLGHIAASLQDLGVSEVRCTFWHCICEAHREHVGRAIGGMVFCVVFGKEMNLCPSQHACVQRRATSQRLRPLWRRCGPGSKLQLTGLRLPPLPLPESAFVQLPVWL